MSTLPYQNETKMAELWGTQATHGIPLTILMLIDGTVSHVLYGYCDMLFNEGNAHICRPSLGKLLTQS